MPITVGGTTITFNDGTTQSTAGGAPTTAQVLTATAGATVGAVGTYAYVGSTSAANVAAGGTIAGSSLRYVSIVGSSNTWFAFPTNVGFGSGGTPAGTWRVMGYIRGGSVSCFGEIYGVTLCLRIS